MQALHHLTKRGRSASAVLALSLLLVACGGGGGGDGETGSSATASPTASAQDPDPATGEPVDPVTEADKEHAPVIVPGAGTNDESSDTPPAGETDAPGDSLLLNPPSGTEQEVPQEEAVQENPPPAPARLNAEDASRFLSQATFGPTLETIDELQTLGYENWLLAEFQKPETLHLNKVLSAFPAGGEFLNSEGRLLPGLENLASHSFWETSIEGDDQLRQRMAYALSQILVFSDQTMFRKAPQMTARYMDILTEGAFGNYRDLLEEVTFSTAMGNYLTYLRSRKGDPTTGSQPDENYARELLQLFTVGLVELHPDGRPVVDNTGRELPVYDNGAIHELAKVFTGLGYQGAEFYQPFKSVPVTSVYSQLAMFEEHNDKDAKSIFGAVIPAGIDGKEGIRMALDAIFAHPNVGPFISRQLIQRFVTSSPAPDYTQRVAAAFNSGLYSLPSGDTVGTGRRGDLQAVLAAILLDEAARGETARARDTFGKVKEPVLRFTHWARAFRVNDADPSNIDLLQASGGNVRLGQHPFRAPSVFNFYRPGYMAPGSSTAAAGLNAPELEIANSTSIVGYASFIKDFIFEKLDKIDPAKPDAYQPDYAYQAGLSQDINALLDNLDLLLTYGTLRDETRDRIAALLSTKAASSPEERQYRVQLATMMIMTSPEYLVLR